MTGCKRGDVVLVGFVFSDQLGIKRRPALVISSEEYNLGRQEAIIVAITSNVSRKLPGDVIISDWQKCGLLFPSLATGIVRTVKQSAFLRKLGTFTTKDMDAVSQSLRHILQI